MTGAQFFSVALTRVSFKLHCYNIYRRALAQKPHWRSGMPSGVFTEKLSKDMLAMHLKVGTNTKLRSTQRSTWWIIFSSHLMLVFLRCQNEYFTLRLRVLFYWLTSVRLGASWCSTIGVFLRVVDMKSVITARATFWKTCRKRESRWEDVL